MSGINGYGSIERDYSLDGGEAPSAGATEGEPVVEAEVVRGGVPSPVNEALANMSASALQKKLMAADDGLTKTEAKAQAKEIKATAEEASELESELKDMKELEKSYEAMLDDPNVDEWDKWWIESDLWDLRLDMYDVQDQLGQLEGELKDLVGGAWGNLLGALTTGLGMIRLEGQKQGDTDDVFRQQRDASRRVKDDLSKMQRDAERRLESLKEKGLVIPVPPKSEVGKKLAAELSKSLDRAREGFSKDRLEELRDVKKKLLAAGEAASASSPSGAIKAVSAKQTQASGKTAAVKPKA